MKPRSEGMTTIPTKEELEALFNPLSDNVPYPEEDERLWKRVLHAKVIPVGDHPEKPGEPPCDKCDMVGWHTASCGKIIPEGECRICYHWDGLRTEESHHQDGCPLWEP